MMTLSLNSLCCEIKNLKARLLDGGDLDVVALQVAIEALGVDVGDLETNVETLMAVYNVEEIHGTGTAYSLTDTAVAIDLGTVDPAIVLSEAGRYLILATVKVEYTGATVAAETATLKLRRTNNTAADIASTPVVIDLPVATTLTHTYGVIHLPPVEYTTANSDDAITMFGNVSAALGAGTIDISMVDIIAVRTL